MTDAYMFRAALYCEGCTNEIKWACIRESPTGLAGSSEDPEYWPQGPFADGGGEADTPSHCDECGGFLENALTSDGEAYVRDAQSRWDGVARRWLDSPAPSSPAAEWRGFYAYLFDDDDTDPAWLDSDDARDQREDR